jgi:hypothetical protein
MGKSCIRFKKLETLALDVLGETVRSITSKHFVELYRNQLWKMKKSDSQKARHRGDAAGATATTRKAAAPKKAAPSRKPASRKKS